MILLFLFSSSSPSSYNYIYVAPLKSKFTKCFESKAKTES